MFDEYQRNILQRIKASEVSSDLQQMIVYCYRVRLSPVAAAHAIKAKYGNAALRRQNAVL